MAATRTIKLVVCSPGDVEGERKVVSSIVDETSRTLGTALRVHVIVWRWETDAKRIGAGGCWPGFP